MPTTDNSDRYRFCIVADEEPPDIGDWLPQDPDHYAKVGPFCGNPADWTDTNPANYRDLTWEEWWSRPDADVANWCSFGLILEWQCSRCDAWHVGPALWGLDYCHESGPMPSEGTYLDTAALSRVDPYLGDVATELIADHEHEASAS